MCICLCRIIFIWWVASLDISLRARHVEQLRGKRLKFFYPY